jgi:2-(1,2-epoxy-1,2-dihydrophenyl)acetyl-CoA isomerase
MSETAPLVRTELLDGGIQLLELSRPQQLNAFNDQLLLELGRAVRAADASDAVRAVVLTGAGRAFCAGADIKSPWDPATAALGLRRRLNPVILALDDLDKPLIAAINGTVAGAGLGFIGVADLRIAARQARFVPATAAIGLVPDGGTSYFVPRLIGPGRAFGWLCGGAHIDADTAADWGLVDEVTDGPVLDRAVELARSLQSARGASLRFTKELLRQSPRSSLAEQLEAEQRFQDRAQAYPAAATN